MKRKDHLSPYRPERDRIRRKLEGIVGTVLLFVVVVLFVVAFKIIG